MESSEIRSPDIFSTKPFQVHRIVHTEKHPFQIDVDGLPNPRGPCEGNKWGSIGFTLWLDMPGVPQNGLKIIKKPDRITVTFSATAPKKENFPFDESERVYAGFVQVNQHPYLVPVIDVGKNGCFLLLFPQNDGALYFLPAPKSAPGISLGSMNSDKGEGSSSGKSIDEAQSVLDQINLGAMNLEGPGKSGSSKISSDNSTKGKTKQGVDSSSGKSQSPKTSSHKSAEGYNCEGSAKTKLEEGSAKFKQGEGSSAKPVDKPEGSGEAGSDKSSSNDAEEAGSDKSSSNDADKAWMLAWIKRNVYQLPVPSPPKEEPALAETSPVAHSAHEAPEIAIGSVEECGIHSPRCQCHCSDSYGVYLKTWSTTEDIIGYINYLKMMGPEGVCEKRVMQEDGQYSLYVRADLPGLEPHLCVTTVRNSCIIVYGRSQSKKNYMRGGRSYLFFVKLRCSCCKFDILQQNHEDGVLRMFCKITRREPGSSAH